MDPRADGRPAHRDRRRRHGRRRCACRSAEAEPFGRDRARRRRAQRSRAFREKPQAAESASRTRPARCSRRWATTSSRPTTLIEAVTRDARDEASRHDLGGDIIPMLVERGEAYVYDFANNEVPGRHAERDRGYWRDVGTLDAYYDAHMDLISVDADRSTSTTADWPILSWPEPLPPAKFVFEEEGRTGRRGRLARVRRRDRLGRRACGARSSRRACACTRYAEVDASVLMHGVDVGRGAVVRNAIVDKNVRIGRGRADRRRPRGRPRALRRLRRRASS